MTTSNFLSLAHLISGGGMRKGKTSAPTAAELPIPPEAAATGLYLHVPFCRHKCHYCDFYSFVDSQGRDVAFVDRLIDELEAVGAVLTRPIETIFFGGGTPTLLPAEQWRRLLDALAARIPLAPGAEITVEANPETVTAELAEILAAGGVNRVSIGCQSFDPALLKALERHHDPENVARSAELLRAAGIGNLNLDLIFAIPGQSVPSWAADLDRALALQPEHISCYGLTYEPNTALTGRLRAGLVEPVDESVEAAMYEAVIQTLAAAGWDHYEISAWARPGRRCRHNLLYWTNGDWWPLGPSASGHLAGLRWKNVPRLGDYLAAGPWPPITDVEPPDPQRAVGETFLMGLRLLDGLPLERVDALLEVDAGDRAAAIERHVAGGLLERAGGTLRLTPRGLLLADCVMGELV